MEIAFYVIQTLIALLGIWVTFWPPDKTEKKKRWVYLTMFLALAIAGAVVTWIQTRDSKREKAELTKQLTGIYSQGEKTGTAVHSLTGSPLKVEVINQPVKTSSPCTSPARFTASLVTIPRMGTGYVTAVRIANPDGIKPIARFDIHLSGEVHSYSTDESLAGKKVGVWQSTTAAVPQSIYHVSVESEVPKPLPLTMLFEPEFKPLHIVCVDRFPNLPLPK
jgi:hypothetical protein